MSLKLCVISTKEYYTRCLYLSWTTGAQWTSENHNEENLRILLQSWSRVVLHKLFTSSTGTLLAAQLYLNQLQYVEFVENKQIIENRFQYWVLMCTTSEDMKVYSKSPSVIHRQKEVTFSSIFQNTVSKIVRCVYSECLTTF